MKKEKYIEERHLKTGTTFRVRITKDGNVLRKSFNEWDYASVKDAFENAVAYRDECLFYMADRYVRNSTKKSVRDVFEMSFELFPVRAETKRKLNIYFSRYINMDTPIQSLDKKDIILSLNRMLQCSDNTISRVFSLWRKICQTAVIYDFTNKDLTLGIKPPKSQKTTLKKDIRTDYGTLLKVIECCQYFRDDYDRYIVPKILMALYETGCRPSEIFALSKEDDKGNFIYINKEIGSDMEENNVLRPCKTDSSVRYVPVSPKLREILDSLDENMFRKKDGTYYNSTDLGNRLHLIVKNRLGINWNMYMLRHLFSNEIRNTDIRTIQSIMGHKSIRMTIDYSYSSDELKLKAVSSRAHDMPTK